MNAQVLLIDELPEDQELYRMGLEHHGFDVTVARSAGDGLRCVKEIAPAVIVAHLRLPDTDAFAICEQLRRDSEVSHLPVVILTAAVRPDGGNRARARALPNCAAFAAKPCTPEELAGLLERVIHGERGLVFPSPACPRSRVVG